MSRMLLTLTVLVALLAVSCSAEERPSAVSPVILPAPQTSVTSTAFNPAITNAGGTTNSAGTFDVVSLARSSSYAGPAGLQQTTSYVISSVKFAPGQSVVTPSYFTAQPGSTSTPPPGAAQSSATASSVSLLSSNASVSAVKSVDSAFRVVVPIAVYNSLGLYLVSLATVVVAATALL